jgi:hypothetical protein
MALLLAGMGVVAALRHLNHGWRRPGTDQPQRQSHLLTKLPPRHRHPTGQGSQGLAQADQHPAAVRFQFQHVAQQGVAAGQGRVQPRREPSVPEGRRHLQSQGLASLRLHATGRLGVPIGGQTLIAAARTQMGRGSGGHPLVSTFHRNSHLSPLDHCLWTTALPEAPRQLRTQSVTPPGRSIRAIPSAASSARMRSALAKSRAALAVRRASIRS